MVSMETLEMEIKNINEDIWEIKEDLKELKTMINKLDDRYPTRREFNAVKRVVSILWWVLWLATTILALKWF